VLAMNGKRMPMVAILLRLLTVAGGWAISVQDKNPERAPGATVESARTAWRSSCTDDAQTSMKLHFAHVFVISATVLQPAGSDPE
jgi:hypothetical protein